MRLRHQAVVCLAPHRAACGPEVDRSAQASWLARLQAAGSSVDRCAEARQPEGCQPEGCPRDARSARAGLCQPAVYRRVVPLSEPRSEQLAVWDAPEPEAAVAAGCALAQPSVVAPAVWEQQAAAVAQHVVVAAVVAGPAFAPEAAGEEAALVLPQVAAGEVAVLALPQVAAAEVAAAPVLRPVAAEAVRQAVRAPQAAAQPSAGGPSSPFRPRSAPARRPAVTRLARAPLRLRIASP